MFKVYKYSGNKTKREKVAYRRPSIMPTNIVFFPSQTSPEKNNESKAVYTNTQQDLTAG
jgi:hypothetical protein